MTAQLSREELKQQLIECRQNESGMFEVGEDTMCTMMALLEVLDSEPVAYLIERHEGFKGYGPDRSVVDARLYNPMCDDFWTTGARAHHTVTPLYAAPPAPVAVPDEEAFWLWLKNKMPTTFRWARELEDTQDNEELIIKGKSSALDMLSAWNACRAAMPEPVTAATVPDGWKLVPVEPTQEMIDAHVEGVQTGGMQKGYRAMLAAAPAAPEQEV